MAMKIELDREAADCITLLNLKDHRGYLKKELKQYKKGGYLHPDDIAKNVELIKATTLIIKYFGEE